MRGIDNVIVIDGGDRIEHAAELLPGKTYLFDVRGAADRQLESRRDLSPKQKRRIKRAVRAQQYAHQARNGGGARETDRREYQIMTDQLNNANGLVFVP